MAYIEGLKESEEALAEIKKILKELEGINEFMSVENPTTLYKLSFTVKNPVPEEAVSPAITEPYAPMNLPQEGFDAKEEDTDKKPSKKVKRSIQYTAPLICDDKDSLYYFIQLYKDRKVRTVRQLMDTHRIRLTEAELAILGNLS